MKKWILLVSLLASFYATAAERISSYSVFTEGKFNPLRMNQIAERFEVVKKLSPGFEVYVQETDVKEFLQLIPNAKLLEKNIHSAFLENKIQNVTKYRKFADVEKDLKSLATTYSKWATLTTYGVTKEKRNLYALKITTDSTLSKPKVLITAATHGDELITTEVLFALTNELLAGQEKDSRLTKILEGREIYIVPVVSPDSFEKRERYVGGQDPNRSYPWPENATNKTVDCIEAMMNYTNTMKFAGTLDLHAYGQLVMYPWGYTKKAPASADVVGFKDLVQSMARDNEYEAGQISTTIYVAKGSSADYFYWKQGTKALAAELGTQKIPDYNKIPQVTSEAREMVWTFLEHFN